MEKHLVHPGWTGCLWQLNINIDMRFMCRLAVAKAMNIFKTLNCVFVYLLCD
jgi:hypothetical protein